MDRPRQVRTLPVRRVEYRVVSKRYIAHSGIEEVLGKRRVFETLRMDDGIGIELRGDAGGDGIKLNSRATRAGVHALRHHSKEVADAYGGFQNVRAGLHAKLLKGLPHGADNLW